MKCVTSKLIQRLVGSKNWIKCAKFKIPWITLTMYNHRAIYVRLEVKKKKSRTFQRKERSESASSLCQFIFGHLQNFLWYVTLINALAISLVLKSKIQSFATIQHSNALEMRNIISKKRHLQTEHLKYRKTSSTYWN